MIRPNISDDFQSIVNYSREEAIRTGHRNIMPDHLYLAMIRHGENYAVLHLKFCGIDLRDMKEFIDSGVFLDKAIPYSEIDSIGLDRNSTNVMSLAYMDASLAGSGKMLPQHLLLALSRTPSRGTEYLREHGLDHRKLLVDFVNLGVMRDNDEGLGNEERKGEEYHPAEEGYENPQTETTEEKDESALFKYGHDLTKAAGQMKLDPVVGRDREIMRVIEILGKRKKNNAILIGEPGVGKSAIVEGIAINIATGNVPDPLLNKRIVSIDIASIVAGTRYRGDFEKRMKEIIEDARNNPDIILFIDEIHTVVGAGGASGSLDAANILKPALARGEFQCIGATTLDEFRKVIEKDGALERRFQKVLVNPTTPAETAEILDRMLPYYEDHHGVHYRKEALTACVTMSERYLTDRCLPDKALDVMDEAGSMVRLHKASGIVTSEDVAAVISGMTGIPVSNIAQSERDKILKMSQRLQNRIIGQKEAVECVVRAIQRNRAGIKDPLRPIGTFLFVGPTGVGKTELAKSIAEYLFDSQDNMVRIDMSEYTEKFNVSRLVGAPPGYVGYGEGGQLSEKVRRKPYSVVLLDEIEKAHPDVFSLLLQVMDDGRLTDSDGRTVDFRNTILIMTSNAGTREVNEYGSGLGFNAPGRNVDAKRRTVLDKALRKTFPPEFINRIDEIVFFNSLTKEDVGKIVDIELNKLKTRVNGWNLSFTPALIGAAAEEGFDPEYGARPLRRAIQRLVEDPVSSYIIRHHKKDKALKLKVDMTDEGPVVSEVATKASAGKKQAAKI